MVPVQPRSPSRSRIAVNSNDYSRDPLTLGGALGRSFAEAHCSACLSYEYVSLGTVSGRNSKFYPYVIPFVSSSWHTAWNSLSHLVHHLYTGTLPQVCAGFLIPCNSLAPAHVVGYTQQHNGRGCSARSPQLSTTCTKVRVLRL